jgi:glycosyltransferase involved in cell wall biosynthesis
MQVLALWETAGLSLTRANPYAGLLARAMEKHGVHTEAGYFENLTPEWIRANRGKVDVLHVHWPWAIYRGATLEETIKRCAAVVDAFVLARSLGYKVVWTMHNLYPHDTQNLDLDHLARLAITSCASAVIVHCVHARRLLERKFHRTGGVFQAPHGHFCDAYPNAVGRKEARARFGFDESHFVYLFFGTLRANKGVEQLLELFPALKGDNLRLLLAARTRNDYGASIIDRARKADSRIVLTESDFYANEDFQWFYNAADIAVFPYSDILTSGSAVTSLSFHCPVLVPRVGCLPEQVNDSVGVLYDPADPAALAQALDRVRHLNRDAMRPAIEQHLREISWEGISRTTLDAYGA